VTRSRCFGGGLSRDLSLKSNSLLLFTLKYSHYFIMRSVLVKDGLQVLVLKARKKGEGGRTPFARSRRVIASESPSGRKGRRGREKCDVQQKSGSGRKCRVLIGGRQVSRCTTYGNFAMASFAHTRY
jgi:hypothetical protein